MKQILFTFLAICLIGNVLAQENPLYDQYLFNNYYLNPAFAGSHKHTPVYFNVRQTMKGFDNSPGTYSGAFHTRVVEKKERKKFVYKYPGHGIGAQLFTLRKGPIKHTGLRMTYAYHFPIGDQNIGLGLTGEFSQYGLDMSSLETVTLEDPAIYDEIDKTQILDADFGVFMHNAKNYWVGFTAAQLIRPMTKFSTNADSTTADNRLSRRFMVNGGYQVFLLGESIILEPSFLGMVRLDDPKMTREFHINGRVAFVTALRNYDKESISLGVSYRTKNSVLGIVQFSLTNIHMGYAYEYYLNEVMEFVKGSHQIYFGYTIER